MSNPWKLLTSLFSIVFVLACPTRDPFAVNPNCPADAPCFLSVIAPLGQTAAPGPYNMVAEVTGPYRIEGVGLVMSVNGAPKQDLRLARLTSGNSLWGVPDLESTTVEPPVAIDTARALAQLQPGDQVTYVLYAWDQNSEQTTWAGDGRNNAESVSFEIVDNLSDDPAADAGPVADSGGQSDGGTPTADAGITPPSGDGGPGISSDAMVLPPGDAG